MTFVSRLDKEHYLEHGLSYYARSKQMGRTPGHDGDAGVKYRIFDPSAAILRCFQCHSTGPPKLSASFAIEPFEAGVRCESCHGPGDAHARTQGKIDNPARLNGKQVNDLCGACHRKVSAEEETNWTDPWNVRHQPLYFAQSRCFVRSEGKMSCFTCHDPHLPLSRNAADYSKRCESCHAKARHRVAVANQACAVCHMPMVKLNANLQFANHWIGVYRPGNKLRAVR